MVELLLANNVQMPSKNYFLSCQTPAASEDLGFAITSGLHRLKLNIVCAWMVESLNKATAKQATNDTFIRAKDAAPEYRPRSQLLLVTELDTGHKRQSPTYKRGTVCLLD